MPPGMSGTGPWAGPPDLSILSRGDGVEGLGEAVPVVVGEGEAVVVVGAGEAVVVVGEAVAGEVVVGVVVCCASTMGGDSHASRSVKPVAKTIRATAAIFSARGVQSPMWSPSLDSSRQLVQIPS